MRIPPARLLALALAFVVLPVMASMTTAQQAAAAFPGTQWERDSSLADNFDCSGHPTSAILGRAKGRTEVALFPSGPGAPVLLSYPERLLDPKTATLTVEPLLFSMKDFLMDNGRPVPPGLEPSETCAGLLLTDAAGHVIHVYWNRERKAFDDWLG
ncbi:MAG: hypothetical protein KGL43_06925 [Burkholderiales bacterium]|nr:hypothetical protein [Burkholderiales bacterium]MDE2453310.1 hypothetical protein [Burkholderiales bacterium]